MHGWDCLESPEYNQGERCTSKHTVFYKKAWHIPTARTLVLEARILNLTERSCLLWFCPIIWLCKQWVCNFHKDINNDWKWLVLLDNLCQILPILILGSWWKFCLLCEITYQNSRISDACIIISVAQLLPHSLWDQFQSLIIIMVIGYASLFPYALIRPFLTLFAISRRSAILLREVSWLLVNHLEHYRLKASTWKPRCRLCTGSGKRDL